MEDNYIMEIGSDLNSNWEFKNGDIVLVENKDNLIQSILNRLNCDYDSLDLYYYDYGSVLKNFLGWKRLDETLEFIRLEVEDALSQDPRINDFNVEVEYNSVGLIVIDLEISFGDDDDFSLNLVLEKGGETVAIGE